MGSLFVILKAVLSIAQEGIIQEVYIKKAFLLKFERTLYTNSSFLS